MKNLRNRIIILSLCVVGALLAFAPVVYSHCQIPCGIYDDPMRFKMMAEDILTVEKSMKAINELSAQPQKDMNQIVRWVNNKDLHADKFSETVTYYFMAQRLKPAEPSDAVAYDSYIKQLTLLHKMLVTAMKAKQTSDLAQTAKLTELLAEFKAAYEAQHPESVKTPEVHDH